DMALDNFVEMMSRVADPRFLVRKAVESAIMRELPQKYRSRYTLVMYSHNPYSKCLKAGQYAADLLEDIVTHCKISSAENINSELDLKFVTELLEKRYLPFLNDLGVSLTFTA
ncbi:hypothetical protein FOZ63_020435, partial [Perkinsus olseni]